MESSSSANEATKGAPAFFSYPFFFHEALRAILKCLGVETKTQENSSSSEPKGDDKVNETSPQEQGVDPPSTTETDPPPSTTDTAVDPPSTTVEDADLTVSLRAPPRAPVSQGNPPRINELQLLSIS